MDWTNNQNPIGYRFYAFNAFMYYTFSNLKYHNKIDTLKKVIRISVLFFSYSFVISTTEDLWNKNSKDWELYIGEDGRGRRWKRKKKMKENRKVGNETNLKKLLFFCYSANLQWREPWAIERRGWK